MTFDGQRMSKSLGTIDRSDRGGAAIRRRSAAAVSREGDRLRRRRRFLVGSDSTSGTTSISRTTSAISSAGSRPWPRNIASGRLTAAVAAGPAGRGAPPRLSQEYQTGMDAFALGWRRRGGLPHGRRGQRVHREHASPGRWPATRRAPIGCQPGAVRRRGSDAGGRDPAAANHAAVGGGDSASSRGNDGTSPSGCRMPRGGTTASASSPRPTRCGRRADHDSKEHTRGRHEECQRRPGESAAGAGGGRSRRQPPTAGTRRPPQRASPRPCDGRISIDDFMKVDLRVAKVLTAEKVPNSRKL